jgi:hypothetical protein
VSFFVDISPGNLLKSDPGKRTGKDDGGESQIPSKIAAAINPTVTFGNIAEGGPDACEEEGQKENSKKKGG